MSRSYRHSPYIGYTTARSDKPGKVQANRTLRVNARNAIQGCADFEELIVHLLREVSSVWDFPKDGKQRLSKGKNYRKYMRK